MFLLEVFQLDSHKPRFKMKWKLQATLPKASIPTAEAKAKQGLPTAYGSVLCVVMDAQGLVVSMFQAHP